MSDSAFHPVSEAILELTIEPAVDAMLVAPEKTSGKSDPGARRTRMREFQARLVERMQAARDGSDTRSGQLGVMVAGRRYLVELSQTEEIVSLGTITNVPLTHPWFLGLTNIRGNLVSIVDFARYLGDAATIIDKQSRIITLAPGLGVTGGLLVSQVLGLRNLADMRVQSAQQESTHDWQRQCFLDSQQMVWQLIDLSAITSSERFLHVAA